MGRGMDPSHLALPGATLRATPGAVRVAITLYGPVIRMRVTTVSEGGKAIAVVTKMLACALGVAWPRGD